MCGFGKPAGPGAFWEEGPRPQPAVATPDVQLHMVETTRAPLGALKTTLKANLSKPISEMYFPRGGVACTFQPPLGH